MKALQELDRQEAYGPFWHSTLRTYWLIGCEAAGVTGLRPYDLRHSYGTAIYAASGDIRATQELMGHSSVALTSRYAAGAIQPRTLDALRKFSERTAAKSEATSETDKKPE